MPILHANLRLRLTRDEHHTMLDALEHSFPNTKRYLIATEIALLSSFRHQEAAAASPPVATGTVPVVAATGTVPVVTPVHSRASTPILVCTPPRQFAAGPLDYSSELVDRAGSISSYDLHTRLYTISVPTGLDRSELGVLLSKTGQHLNLIQHLRGATLWVDPVCIMDVEDNSIHHWWTLHSGHPNPDCSGSYLY
eukprot:2588182-Rhodomonas_salina.4